jgi:LPS export ABC transporter protein LptC
MTPVFGRAVLLSAALGIVLTLGCSSGKQPPVAVKNPLADSADQVLFHTKSVITDNGVMKAEVYGDTAYVFDDNTRVEMRVVRTVFFTVTGAKNAVLTSREGTYNTRTNNMEARGDVVVISEDGRRLTTPILKYSQARNEISSDTSFTLTTDSTHHMIGIGFTSDPDMNNMVCLRACSGSAGTVTLPGGASDTARPGTPVRPPGSAARPVPSSGMPPSAGGGVATAPGAAARAAAHGRATGTLPPGMPGAVTAPGAPGAASPPAGQPKASTAPERPTP